MKLTRRLPLIGLALALLAVFTTPAAAQDDGWTITEEVAASYGVTLEELVGLEPNPSWNDLGLFSDDLMRLLEAASGAADAQPYAFGDDPSTPPVITPDGANPIATGRIPMLMPAEWTPPPVGVNGATAFAQTGSSPLEPGELVSFVWVEFDSAYDFGNGLSLNEGFPITLPDLPVWNSSFAGDTWEGANVIPNAVFNGGVLTFDVKSYEPPQSFPLVDVGAFYYRSGNVMAMAISVEDLAAVSETRGAPIAITTGERSADDQPQTLLFTGEADTVTVQAELTPRQQALLDWLRTRLGFKHWNHISEGGTFLPGFIAFIDVFGGDDLRELIEETFPDIELPSEESIAEEVDEIEEELEDTREDAEEEGGPAPRDEVTEEELDELEFELENVDDTGASDGGGGSLILILILVAVAVLVAIAIAIMTGLIGGGRRRSSTDDDGTRERTPTPPPTTPPALPPTTGGGEMAMILDPMDGVPPDEDEPVTECGWEVIFDDDGVEVPLKTLRRGQQRCCVYRIRIVTDTLYNDAVASFRQDAPAERQYIPVLEQAPTAMDWDGITATRSGPAGRQDWQHGDGDPVDTSGQGDPTSYFQVGQGEERLDVATQIFHLEKTTVEVVLEPGCNGHANTFASESEARLWMLSSQECTNDDPGPACPVELSAFGAADAMASGDTNVWVGYEHGTDTDELERHASALADMAPADRERWAPPVLDVTGGWDGHDHETRAKLDLENSSSDTSSESKDDVHWRAVFSTNAALLAGQLVPTSTWPTTERVSSHIQFGLGLSLDLTATLDTPDCPDDCSAHPGLQCHGGAGFSLHLGSSGSSIAVEGEVYGVDRPASAGDGRALRTGARSWQVDSTAGGGRNP